MDLLLQLLFTTFVNTISICHDYSSSFTFTTAPSDVGVTLSTLGTSIVLVCIFYRLFWFRTSHCVVKKARASSSFSASTVAQPSTRSPFKTRVGLILELESDSAESPNESNKPVPNSASYFPVLGLFIKINAPYINF